MFNKGVELFPFALGLHAIEKNTVSSLNRRANGSGPPSTKMFKIPTEKVVITILHFVKLDDGYVPTNGLRISNIVITVYLC